MKKIFLSSITLFLFVILSNGILHAETKNPLKELEKVLGKTFKTLSGKKLNKKNTKKFILNFAITLKDERNDGLVTYVFKENEYSRYKDFKIISTDGWRFTNTGSLRIFDADIKLTWKIKLDKNESKKNVINIKAKYDPIGKLYGFTYKPIDEFLNDLDEHEKKIDEEKKRLEKEKLDAQKQSDEEKKLEKMVSTEKYYALVIGNNNYEHLEKLDAAQKDAEVIADVLQNKYGFEVELLLNGDYRTTVNSIFNMTDKLKENDNLLIYYAGHGELEKAENRGYWLPVDANKKSRAEWISNSRIVDRIKATKAKHVLLMVDSCFSGTLMRSGTTPEVKETIDEKYIERLKGKKTRLVITSGGNEPVVDSDGGQHSLFALKLIDTLKNNNSVINSQILFENIRRYVVSNTEQTPERAMVHKTGHDGGDFLFFAKN